MFSPAIYEVAMNSEEQTLIDGLFSRLQQAETEAAPRDAEEPRCISHQCKGATMHGAAGKKGVSLTESSLRQPSPYRFRNLRNVSRSI